MELTLDQALIKGIEAHKAGKLQEADRYYTAIQNHPSILTLITIWVFWQSVQESSRPFPSLKLRCI